MNAPNHSREIKGKLSNRFRMKDLGRVRHFLEIEVDENYNISQKDYITQILQRLCLKHVKPALSPICRLFLFLSFAYRLFLFSVLLFLAQAFAARSGSCTRRRSGSSFRRAPCFRRWSCSSSRRMLSAFVFRRWPQALAVVPQVALLFLFCSVPS
jgi:hypothetical protein